MNRSPTQSHIPVSSGALQSLSQALDQELNSLRDRALLRTLTTVEAIDGARIRVDGRWLVSWSTNDYLGLSSHPRVIQAACDAAVRWGVGARASRLLAGSTRVHEQLEAQLASFFRAEAAVVFPSGYLANLGTLRTLLAPGDVVLVDRLAHASLIEACRGSGATFRVFRHHDVGHAAKLLARYPGVRRRLIVTEGLFSMDGDSAPLPEFLEVAQAHEAFLYVDDAHGAFAIGTTGRGSPERAGVPHEAMIYMGTLGKALGCQGGFVVGPRVLVDAVHHRARTFIYSTALAVPVAAAALEALLLIQDDPSPRQRLGENVQSLQRRVSRIGPSQIQVPSHIVPVVVGSSSRARAVSSALQHRGLFAPAIRPPTVPEGTSRLRISVSALHTEEQLDALVEALSEVLSFHEVHSPQSTVHR